MTGQIMQPNFTALAGSPDFSFQSYWRERTDACYRPAFDLGIPIACSVSGVTTYLSTSNVTGSLNNTWSDFERYSMCCPQAPQSKRAQPYTSSRNCVSAMCFTTENSTALAFAECVERAASQDLENLKQAGKVPKDASLSYKPTGRCEFIDNQMLKRGIQSDTKASTASAGEVRHVYLAMALAGCIVCVMGGMM